MFLLPAAMIVEKLFGAEFSAVHRVLTYGLGALFHGVAVALLLFLLTLFSPRLSRRRGAIALAVVVVVDLVFLLLVSPMHELP
jgi:hypothetical protein